jgi:hypothetical protein
MNREENRKEKHPAFNRLFQPGFISVAIMPTVYCPLPPPPGTPEHQRSKPLQTRRRNL